MTPAFPSLSDSALDDVFIHVINDHYKDTEGQFKIRNQEYIFEDKNQKPLSLAGVWSSDILSGKSIFMRVLSDEDIRLETQRCPACKSKNEDACTQGELVWSVLSLSSIDYN